MKGKWLKAFLENRQSGGRRERKKEKKKKTLEGLNNAHIGADSKCPRRKGNISPQGAVDQEEMEQCLGHTTIFSQPALTVTGLCILTEH